MEVQILLKIYRSSNTGLRGYVKLATDMMIIKNWEKIEDIPFPGDFVSFTDTEILQQRKRFISVDGNRFKKIKTEE